MVVLADFLFYFICLFDFVFLSWAPISESSCLPVDHHTLYTSGSGFCDWLFSPMHHGFPRENDSQCASVGVVYEYGVKRWFLKKDYYTLPQ